MDGFGKGINITSGFDLGAESPLDSREVVNTLEELDIHVSEHRAYEGMMVYVKETQKVYQYINNKWIEFVGGSSNNNNNDDNNNNVGNGVHIGEEPPEDTSQVWIDNGVENQIPPTPHLTRLKEKYLEMLRLTNNKITKLNEKIAEINKLINLISNNEHQNIKKEFQSRLGNIRSEYNLLILRLNNVISLINTSNDIEAVKISSQTLRKDVKKSIYDSLDLLNEIKRIIDSEKGIIIPEDDNNNNNNDNDEPIETFEGNLLTESGLNILTEDGLVIIAEGIEKEEKNVNAILTELGESILTEDGLVIIAEGINNNEAVADSILTELGKVLLTENGKQILKG